LLGLAWWELRTDSVQTLIRDVFCGAFFLTDDAFRKAEYVEIDQVGGVVKDPVAGPPFLQLKSQGVYTMEDSAMIIRGQVHDQAGQSVRDPQGRDLFYREGIRFAHRQVTVRLADDSHVSSLTEQQKKAIVGSVHSVIEEELPSPADELAAATDR
jgi:hypothetical protein